MKRIGYVGLSTPSFYDYRNPASETASDTQSSPNPVIEGAFGALLLYDELWFLCRSLCPENMRHLPYVRFMEERGEVPNIDFSRLPTPESVFQPAALKKFSRSSAAYRTVKKQAHVYWDAAADNHTHGLIIGGYELNGNSWSVRNVLYDMYIVQRLPANVDLITNSFTSKLFKTEASIGARLRLTESIVLNNVPQFLGPKGPYHSCIEEVRESSYLSHYRKWILEEAFKAPSIDIREIKDRTERRLEEAQREIFLKYLEPRAGYRTAAETVLGFVIDFGLPGSSTIAGLGKQLIEEPNKESQRWQGFILETQQKIKYKKKQTG